nr:acyl-CoA dehydrogenase [Myxococcota bacterium]
MDLSYGSEMEGFRDEVKDFLEVSWPLKGDAADLPFERQASLFRETAIEQGYLYRNIPTKYGGSEQES